MARTSLGVGRSLRGDLLRIRLRLQAAAYAAGAVDLKAEDERVGRRGCSLDRGAWALRKTMADRGERRTAGVDDRRYCGVLSCFRDQWAGIETGSYGAARGAITARSPHRRAHETIRSLRWAARSLAGGLRPLRAGPAVGGVRPRRQAAWASSMAAVAFIARRSLPAGWTVMTKPRHETEKPGNPHDDTG